MSDYSTSSGRGGRYEQHAFWRRPLKGENAGWITIQGTNMERRVDLESRGFECLTKYGTIEAKETALRRAGQLGQDEVMNPYRTILDHPDGPREFPAEQVMELRWYQEEHCPVPGTKFPQLGGHSISEYRCPECERLPFAAIDGVGGIEPLARHLRVHHSWDRQSLVRYGERVNIDFDAIYSQVKHEYEFDGGKSELPKKPRSGFACGECDWTPKANAKKPALALSLHQKTHEFTLETVEA